MKDLFELGVGVSLSLLLFIGLGIFMFIAGLLVALEIIWDKYDVKRKNTKRTTEKKVSKDNLRSGQGD